MILHNNNYEELFKFENELEELIKEKYEKSKNKIDKFKKFEKESINDKTLGIVLLKQINNKRDNNTRDYPYYKHFYYFVYLIEEYIDRVV